MGKKHDTFEGEQPEMEPGKKAPEVKKPSDPLPPEVGPEYPEELPGELPEQDQEERKPGRHNL